MRLSMTADKWMRLTDVTKACPPTYYPFFASPSLRAGTLWQAEPFPAANAVILEWLARRCTSVCKVNCQAYLGLNPRFGSAWRNRWEHNRETIIWSLMRSRLYGTGKTHTLNMSPLAGIRLIEEWQVAGLGEFVKGVVVQVLSQE